jgi:hypothetical protein
VHVYVFAAQFRCGNTTNRSRNVVCVFVEFSIFRRLLLLLAQLPHTAIAWGGYRNAGLVSEADGEMLNAFEGKSFDEMLQLFDDRPTEHAVMLLRVVDSVNKEEAQRYLLAAISLFFKGTYTRCCLARR